VNQFILLTLLLQKIEQSKPINYNKKDNKLRSGSITMKHMSHNAV